MEQGGWSATAPGVPTCLVSRVGCRVNPGTTGAVPLNTLVEVTGRLTPGEG